MNTEKGNAMSKTEWSSRIVIRYSLLQLPGTVLLIGLLFLARRWMDVPLWLMWLIPGAWVIKDIILFPFIWRAYDWDQKDKRNNMIGMHGIVSDRLDPSGYIIVRGELWRAETLEKDVTIEKGQNVQIHGINGLTLYVKPLKTFHPGPTHEKILKNNRHKHMILFFTLLLASSLSSSSCHKTQGNEIVSRKMPTILLNLVNSDDPVTYAKAHGITLKNGMVRIVITLDENITSRDFLSEYDLKDYEERKNLVTAYISIDGLRKLCEDPAVIYVRLPVKFNSR
jgi:membrane protein implicated in regulation of membrane protease activity